MTSDETPDLPEDVQKAFDMIVEGLTWFVLSEEFVGDDGRPLDITEDPEKLTYVTHRVNEIMRTFTIFITKTASELAVSEFIKEIEKTNR